MKREHPRSYLDFVCKDGRPLLDDKVDVAQSHVLHLRQTNDGSRRLAEFQRVQGKLSHGAGHAMKAGSDTKMGAYVSTKFSRLA
jgi:hypothetical protein